MTDITIESIFFIEPAMQNVAEVNFYFVSTRATKIGGMFTFQIQEHWTINDIKKEIIELYNAQMTIKK
jgi:hypothetical protein